MHGALLPTQLVVNP